MVKDGLGHLIDLSEHQSPNDTHVVLIFNKRGIKLNKLSFFLKSEKLEVVDRYKYLGIILKPSGCFDSATDELKDKATRAWYGISNIIFRDKRMQIDRIFNLFDSLVYPVASYANEIWLPSIIPKKYFKGNESLLDFWEKFRFEVTHQKCAKMALSVNSKTSRLAVLGELGRYPLLIQSLAKCLNYRLSLFDRRNQNVLLDSAIIEMEALENKNSVNWLGKVNKMWELIKLNPNLCFKKSSGKTILNLVKGCFDLRFLEKINETKSVNSDPYTNHNKLRTYSSFKASFTREPYLDIVRNRNQRCFLTRLRVSSHNLRIETGRHAYKTSYTS